MKYKLFFNSFVKFQALAYNSNKSMVLERILKPILNVERPNPGQNNDLNTIIKVMLASNDVISKEFIEFYEGIQSKGIFWFSYILFTIFLLSSTIKRLINNKKRLDFQFLDCFVCKFR